MVKSFGLTIGRRMNYVFKPWHILFLALAGWVHREQQQIIEFYQADQQRAEEAAPNIESKIRSSIAFFILKNLLVGGGMTMGLKFWT